VTGTIHWTYAGFNISSGCFHLRGAWLHER
jgi:hypothetical protein